MFVIKLNQMIPCLQLTIPSDGHFCQRLYTYSYNLQGYWLDEGHDRTVLIESDEVYLVQKPHYKLNESVSVPENPLYKWNKFKYLPGLNLEPKLTFALLKVHKLVREFVFQDTDNKVYFTSNHRWVKFQAKYPTSFVFDQEHHVVMSFHFVYNATLLLLHQNGRLGFLLFKTLWILRLLFCSQVHFS